jgi:hypothetical protein
MTNNQKLIKNIAIGFAIVVAISIVGGIISMIGFFVNIGSGRGAEKADYVYEITEEVTSISIDHEIGTLSIQTGDRFLVEAESVGKDFKCQVSNGTLVISENGKNSFFSIGFNSKGLKTKITITIPEDFSANKVNINAGAGNINITNLTTEYLKINGGAGNIKANDIWANKVELDNGVGNMNFINVVLNDVDLDGGVGNVNITGIMTGKNDIDAGVGNIDISLEGKIDDYNLSVSPGLGRVSVNGTKQGEIKNSSSGAEHSIKVDGGVGNIDIDIY